MAGQGIGKRGYTKQEVLKAIKGTSGIITNIAATLKCDWNTADKYIKMWPETLQAYRDEKEKIGDLCESKLYRAIQADNIDAAKWYLSKKHKERGYGDKIELTGKIEHSIETEELLKFADQFKKSIDEKG